VDNELEVIRHQMEETRSSLADKLETLENEFRGTVEEATSAVSTTVEAVQETVETVKETFDLRTQVERHPWPLMAGAVATGYVAGCLAERSPPVSSATTQPPVPAPPAHAAAPASAATAGPGPFDSVMQRLKGLAIGGLMSLAREFVTRIAPAELASELVGVVDDLTTKLGGKPLRNTAPERRRDECPSGEPDARSLRASESADTSPERPQPNGRSGKRPAAI